MMTNNNQTATAWLKTSRSRLLAVGLIAATLIYTPGLAAQDYFPSAEMAADALVIAAARQDEDALQGLLGDDFRRLMPLDDINEDLREKFFQSWIVHHSLVPIARDQRMLAVGEEGWTLPVPIVKESQGWRFDTHAGSELMRVRAIGRNELSAMQAALAYRDAQIEYAGTDHDADGVSEYAQKFRSESGKRDGLYWDTSADEPQSPLGPLFAGELPTDDYHGYHFKILTAQGASAPGGAQNYLHEGHMIGGFALIAWPAEYGNSGIMSFMLSRDGILYEADLGPDGGTLAMNMTEFNPAEPWRPVLAEFTQN